MITFEYPTHLSKLRENYLVNYLENVAVAEMLKTQAMLIAQLIPVSSKPKNTVKDAFDLYRAYSEIILPIGKKQAKIEDMTHEDLAAVRASIKKAKDSLKRPKK